MDVVRPVVAETTALGAAYAATGIAVGYWNGEQDVIDNWAEDKRWTPIMDQDERERLYRQWKKAVTRTFDWVDDDVAQLRLGTDVPVRRTSGAITRNIR